MLEAYDGIFDLTALSGEDPRSLSLSLASGMYHFSMMMKAADFVSSVNDARLKEIVTLACWDSEAKVSSSYSVPSSASILGMAMAPPTK